MSDKAREEFEAWAASDGYQLDASSDARFTYDFHETECAWYGWQASRASPVVNACAGMADPAAEIAELRRQRDELLAVLGAAIPLIKQARLDWCDQNAESYDEDVVTPYDAILYRPILSLLENKGSAS